MGAVCKIGHDDYETQCLPTVELIVKHSAYILGTNSVVQCDCLRFYALTEDSTYVEVFKSEDGNFEIPKKGTVTDD